MNADLSIVIPTSNGLSLLRENLPSGLAAAETYRLETDAEISQMLNRFYRSAPIQIYYNQQEVIQKHPEFKKVKEVKEVEV
ncbi:hypothetical protein MYX82_07610 [Acidobacteria bacterium AH-259-D05]|nr:hypothetical protein [Acidobacteria bacterium AH-259-D05]